MTTLAFDSSSMPQINANDDRIPRDSCNTHHPWIVKGETHVYQTTAVRKDSEDSKKAPPIIHVWPSLLEAPTAPRIQRPVEEAAVSQCCRPQPADTFDIARGLGSAVHMNLGVTPDDSLSLQDPIYGAFAPDLNFEFFSEWEGRHGCSQNGQFSNHMDGSGEQPDCHCGDRCMCLGCSQHPNNSTTQEYARWHHAMTAQPTNPQPDNMTPIGTHFQSGYQTAPYHSGDLQNSATAPSLQHSQYLPSVQPYDLTLGTYGSIDHVPPHQISPAFENGHGADAHQHYTYHNAMAPSTPAPNTGFQAQMEPQRTQHSTPQERLDYHSFDQHRRTGHFRCQHRDCSKKNMMFKTAKILKAHQMKIHPAGSTKKSSKKSSGLSSKKNE